MPSTLGERRPRASLDWGETAASRSQPGFPVELERLGLAGVERSVDGGTIDRSAGDDH